MDGNSTRRARARRLPNPFFEYRHFDEQLAVNVHDGVLFVPGLVQPYPCNGSHEA
jgi:hypothetical protein